MKKLYALLLPVLAMILLLPCSGEKKSGAGRPQIISNNTVPVEDSVIEYETNYKTKQKSYKKELLGEWKVITMRRQQKAELESLTNVTLRFSADTSFGGKAPCNGYGGTYILKGTSVKFSHIIHTMMACDNIEKENAFLNLLENTVSAYSVDGSKLLLRDGSSNVVFECKR